MLKEDYGSKWLAIQICYVHMLPGLLQIMLPLENTNLGSSLGRNLSVHMVNTQLNQDDIFFMIVVDSIATRIQEGTH